MTTELAVAVVLGMVLLFGSIGMLVAMYFWRRHMRNPRNYHWVVCGCYNVENEHHTPGTRCCRCREFYKLQLPLGRLQQCPHCHHVRATAAKDERLPCRGCGSKSGTHWYGCPIGRARGEEEYLSRPIILPPPMPPIDVEPHSAAGDKKEKN